MSQLVRRHLLAGRFLGVVSFRVNGVLADHSIGLAWWAPGDEDRFGGHDEGFDRDRGFGG